MSSDAAADAAATEREAAEALARAAGLDKAWAGHRAAILEAVAAARKLRDGFARPTDPAAEPTPPYRAPAAEERAR